MFSHLIKRTEFFVCVLSLIKLTNTNELPAERFTNCSLNVRFVCSPTLEYASSFFYANSDNQMTNIPFYKKTRILNL
ncbi:hypothetical protein Hanom_Chr11g00980911 [Helianthus anomalus]